jgi:hypothetical protein
MPTGEVFKILMMQEGKGEIISNFNKQADRRKYFRF